MVRLSRSISVLGAALCGLGTTAIAQNSSEAPPASEGHVEAVDLSPESPLVLNVARQRLKNFLTDETVLAPYKAADGSYRDLISTFTIGTPSGHFAVFWDSETCRLLGALDLESPPKSVVSGDSSEGEDNPASSPYPLLAEGPHPFNRTGGFYGEPAFFGFRMSNGVPTYLYTCGNLVIEERIWLADGGDTLKQMFTIRDPKSPVSYSVPEAWKERVGASVGEWKDNVLTIPKDEASEFLISYRLGDEVSGTDESN